MTSRRHRHHAIKSEDWGFRGCVNPASHKDEAHGNIVRVDTCKCGATKAVNINGFVREIGRWLEDDDDNR